MTLSTEAKVSNLAASDSTAANSRAFDMKILSYLAIRLDCSGRCSVHLEPIPEPVDAASSRIQQAARCRFYEDCGKFWDRLLYGSMFQSAPITPARLRWGGSCTTTPGTAANLGPAV